jgi:uncharacterized pyridoxal phosphate-dependent enzyme
VKDYQASEDLEGVADMFKKWNDRRTFLKWMASTPLVASLADGFFPAPASAASSAGPTTKAGVTPEIYARIGARTIINGRGTYTYLSGSVELPGVREAMRAASFNYVNMYDLQTAAGAYLAKIAGTESGMVTSGSAGSMSAATAACLAGSDPVKIYQLPDTTGMKSEVIMIGSRNAFDSAIRLAGAKLVVVPAIDGLPAAINSKTAMIYNSSQRDDESIKNILAVSKPAGVPLLVDAAAGIPPFDNFSRFAKLGVDLYCFSGGKGMCGPQDSGILLGRKDLIEAARYNCAPWEGSVCRPMKVGKEEIMGVIAAVDYWAKADPNAQWKEWQHRAERMKDAVKDIPGLMSEIIVPPNSNSFPTLALTWDEQKFGLSVMECAAQLREGEPSIETLTPVNPSVVMNRLKDLNHPPHTADAPLRLQVASLTLQEGEDVIVGRRLSEVLTGALKKAGV